MPVATGKFAGTRRWALVRGLHLLVYMASFARVSSLTLAMILGASVTGCTRSNPSHCGNRGGDDFCQQRFGEDAPHCNLCVAEFDGCSMEPVSEPACMPDADSEGDVAASTGAHGDTWSTSAQTTAPGSTSNGDGASSTGHDTDAASDDTTGSVGESDTGGDEGSTSMDTDGWVTGSGSGSGTGGGSDDESGSESDSSDTGETCASQGQSCNVSADCCGALLCGLVSKTCNLL